MRKVHNWQVGRPVSYIYPEKRPKAQWAMIFDLNKCIACQTCTIACGTTWTSGRGQEYMYWNNVETKPFGGYPTAWDVSLLAKLGPQTWEGGRYTGRTIFESAAGDELLAHHEAEEEDWNHPNLGEDEVSGPVGRGDWITRPHKTWMFYLPRVCGHCTYPACLGACPRRAIYKRPEDGIVLIDQSRCRGYRECVRACPYKKPMFNAETRTSEKCVGCYPKFEAGEMTQCVTHCIGKIRLMGRVSGPERADPRNPIDYLVHTRKIALPLYPQFGLETNLYYIPPVHVPAPYLEQMFGPGVRAAIDAYLAAPGDDPLKSLLVLFGSTERALGGFHVDGGNVTGFDLAGNPAVTVPLVEPLRVRDAFDPRIRAYRHNTM